MRVLWLCNVALPMIADKISHQKQPFGGWMEGMANALMKKDNIELIVLFPNKNVAVEGELRNLKFYGFAAKKQKAFFEEVLKKEKPDIVHIFGTEYKHTFDMTEACRGLGIADKAVINIQGLVSVYHRHYYADLPNKVIYSKTLFELLFRRGIRKSKAEFVKKGFYECEAIKNVRYVIGRTDLDYAGAKKINPNARYLFCNESLRASFYANKWTYDNCEKHSIFVSQSSYPLKGFHKIIEAMPDILRSYPDAHIYTTGKSPFAENLTEALKMTSYKKYLKKLIKKYNLKDKITFLGVLSEEEMVKQYLKANVFLSASSIENSPNSVGEAMILGVPVVSSDVGGVKNMLEHGREGYVYPFDEPYMAAYYINKIFGEEDKLLTMCENAREHALKTHDREENLKTQMRIYENIANNCNWKDKK